MENGNWENKSRVMNRTGLVSSVTSGGPAFASSCSRANDSIADAVLAPSYGNGLSLSAPKTMIVGNPCTLYLLIKDWKLGLIRNGKGLHTSVHLVSCINLIKERLEQQSFILCKMQGYTYNTNLTCKIIIQTWFVNICKKHTSVVGSEELAILNGQEKK